MSREVWRRVGLVLAAAAVLTTAWPRLGAAAQAVGRAKIRSLDVVEVKAGPAPVQMGPKAVATAAAGTVLVALEVNGAWVGVAVEQDGQTVQGWIHQKHLSRVATLSEPGAVMPAKLPSAVRPRTVRIVGLDGKERSRTLAAGDWVAIGANKPFCYWGGTDLRFESEGPLVFVSDRGRPRVLAGVDPAQAPQAVAGAVRLALARGAGAAARRPITLWLNEALLGDPAPFQALCTAPGVAIALDAPTQTSLAPLAQFPHVVGLCLNGCAHVADLAPLAKLPELQSLALIRCTAVRDLAPLAALPRLQALRLHSTPAVADLAPLSRVPALQSLYCFQLNGVADLAPLAAAPRLSSLHLIACNAVADLAPLARLRGLRALTLGPCPNVADLAPLGQLHSLASLRLIGTKWDHLADLAAIGELAGLRSLELIACTRVADLAPLAGLTRLQALSVAETAVADLAPLARLIRLTRLDLRQCTRVSDLAPLARLTRLTAIDLSYCPELTDLTPLAELPRLRSVDLRHCPKVADITPLAEVARRGGKVLVDAPPKP